MMFRILMSVYFLLSPGILLAQKITESQVAHCISLDGFTYMDITAFPRTPTTRTLEYSGGKIILSLQEAYRVRYAWKGIKFMDVKIEYPQDGNFEQELAALTKYYQHVSTDQSMVVHTSADSMGFQVFLADRRYLSDDFMFLSTDLLVDKRNKRFIYVYYWNPNRQKKLLENIDDFLVEKKRSLMQVAKCLKGNK